jgi:hypothetical protein
MQACWWGIRALPLSFVFGDQETLNPCILLTPGNPQPLHSSYLQRPSTPAFFLPHRFSGNDGRAGTARLLLGLGLAPGSAACRGLLERINASPGFMATDISDMDLAQVAAGKLQASPLLRWSCLTVKSAPCPAFSIPIPSTPSVYAHRGPMPGSQRTCPP